MKPVRLRRCCLGLLLPFTFGIAGALTLDLKAVRLSAEQQAALNRFVAETLPTRTFDWTTLTAYATSARGRRQPVSVTLTTVPALRAAGICQREEHNFDFDTAESRRSGGWQARLTRFQAWMPHSGDCTQVSAAIDVDRGLPETDFLFLHRQQDALRSRAAGVIGGSDCARVRFCEVTLRHIGREVQENPTRAARSVTTLTFSPLTPGPACLYVMEVSFVGPLNDMVPLGARCPVP